ncbi:MAG: hypothetical protein HQ515_11245 [Phycisphaeraceae bacterium]|nr:hypothetical protein [Phycisphaeraceae bacterium]
MKNNAWRMCLAMTCLCGLTVCQAYEWETQGTGGVFFPTDELWDSAWAGEFKIIGWEDDLGMALTAGVAQWDVKEKTDVLVNTAIRSTWNVWQGDVQYIPIGFSLLERYDLGSSDDGTIAQIEVGVLYMLANDNMEVVQTDRVLSGLSVVSETVTTAKVSTDDAVVARLGMALQWDMGQQTLGIVSGGYQFDLTQGDATADSLSVKEKVDLSAFYVQFGFAYMW